MWWASAFKWGFRPIHWNCCGKQCFQIASGVFEDEGDQLDVNYADIELFSSKWPGHVEHAELCIFSVKINTSIPNKSQGWCRVSAGRVAPSWWWPQGEAPRLHHHLVCVWPWALSSRPWPVAALLGWPRPCCCGLVRRWLAALPGPHTGPDPFLAPSWPCLVTMDWPGDLGPRLPPRPDMFAWTWGWSPSQGLVLMAPFAPGSLLARVAKAFCSQAPAVRPLQRNSCVGPCFPWLVK